MATASVTNDFVAAATIVSDDVDQNFTDLVTFLNDNTVHIDGAKTMTGSFLPTTDNDVNLGSGSKRWKTIFGALDNEHSGVGSTTLTANVDTYENLTSVTIPTAGTWLLISKGNIEDSVLTDHKYTLAHRVDTTIKGQIQVTTSAAVVDNRADCGFFSIGSYSASDVAKLDILVNDTSGTKIARNYQLFALQIL